MYGLRFKGLYPSAVAEELEAFLATLRAWLAVDHNEDGTHNLRPSGFDFVPIGALMAWGADTAPDRWLICDGRAVSRTTYRALFEIIGTTYGAGDGSTTFNLPDFRGRFALGVAASGTGATLGATGGAIDHVHTGPSHTHSIASVADHQHAVTTLQTTENGAHDHGGTESDGSGTTGGAGGHSHSGTATSDNNGVTTVDVGSAETVPTTANTYGFSTSIESNHTHSTPAHTHDISADGDHQHTLTGSVDAAGGHDHGAATGSSGTGNTGTANPPFVTVHFIILAGA